MSDELRMLKSSIEISEFTLMRIKEVKEENNKLKQELQRTREQLEKCESVLKNYAICDDVGTVARRYFKDKQGE